MNEDEVITTVGEDGFYRLVSAFYRQVAQDDILGPMYPKHDMAGAEERLREFLIFRFGGSSRYLEKRGHPRLRMRHMPFVVDQAARDRWIQLMSNAFQEAKLPPAAETMLREFFEHVATFLINRPDPAAHD